MGNPCGCLSGVNKIADEVKSKKNAVEREPKKNAVEGKPLAERSDVMEASPSGRVRTWGADGAGGRWHVSLAKMRKTKAAEAAEKRLQAITKPLPRPREFSAPRPPVGKPIVLPKLECCGFKAIGGCHRPAMAYRADQDLCYFQIEGDNSCLFNAVLEAVGDSKTADELRKKAIADYIAYVPDEQFELHIPEEFKGKGKKAYTLWIGQKDSWGGAMELQVLAEFYYGIQICVVNVPGGHMQLFPDEAPTSNLRIYILFTGVHYDCVMPKNDEDARVHAGLFRADDVQTEQKIREAVPNWEAFFAANPDA